MRKLFYKMFFVLIVSALYGMLVNAKAQFIDIPIEKYTMQVPDVNLLQVKPLSYQYDYVTEMYTRITPDSIVTDSVTNVKTAYFDGVVVTKKEYQEIYYKLVKEDGRSAWDGNWNVPIMIYSNNISQYVRGTVTPSVIATLTGFFAASGNPEIRPIMPTQ